MPSSGAMRWQAGRMGEGGASLCAAYSTSFWQRGAAFNVQKEDCACLSRKNLGARLLGLGLEIQP
jgi:hypothetical protein